MLAGLQPGAFCAYTAPMSRSLRNLIEAQIRKAQAQGKLDHLEGEGKPLPHRHGDALIDPETLRVSSDNYRPIGRMQGPDWYCRTRDQFEMGRSQ